MNTHHSALTLDICGQFEQMLYKDSLAVCLLNCMTCDTVH
jgi:hypothetical protein